ncbi:LicD family protein [[Pasteurella] aerogenes]|nr:LicD family protein [[Pasteurella] aerogenes]
MFELIKSFLDKHQSIKSIVLLLYSNTLGKYFFYKENKNFLKHGEITLSLLDHIFKTNKIEYWLDFGTLLGAVRDKDFIPHDVDIDISMWLSDYTEILHEQLEKNGFKKVRDIKIDNGKYGLEVTYQFNSINIDIFFYTKIDEHFAYYHDFIPLKGISRIGTIKQLGGLVVRQITLPVEYIGNITFKNSEYPIPEPVTKHLVGRYGETYMIRDSSWNITKGNQESVKILEDKLGIVTYYQ